MPARHRPRYLNALVVVLICLPLWAGTACAAPALHYALDVELDPETRMLEVAGTIAIPAGKALRLALDARYRVERFDVEGSRIAGWRTSDGATTYWMLSAPRERALEVRLRYAGELPALQALDHRKVLALAQPMCGPEGAFLPAGTGWYPQAEGESVTYRFKVTVGGGFRAVMPGELTHETRSGERHVAVFESVPALPGIDLMAGPYTVRERMLKLGSGRTVRVRAYFHSELAESAPDYVRSAASYITLYDREIGAYAFDSYSIVSSPLPTGFGMPGVAYLGRQVLKLPFIRATSLRHEVLHDWWGNGVVAHAAEGNWAEGLTTLLADHAYREEQGEAQARAMRLGWLRDYAAVDPKADRPLSRFVSRRHGVDQAVGYNKAAFVFFMLRDRIGADAFRAGLQALWRDRRLRRAGWSDLQHAFETQARTDLSRFFRQWVQMAGAPLLTITDARRVSASDHKVLLELRQEGTDHEISVPLRIHHEGGTTEVDVNMRRTQVRSEFPLPARALYVEIDPDVRLFRRLHPEEIAPTLRQVMLDPETRVALAASTADARSAALRVAQAALEADVKLLGANSTEVRTPLLIVGLHAEIMPLLARLGLPHRSVPGAEAEAAYAYAWRTPDGIPFTVVSAADADALAALARSLPHLGAQSYAVFAGSRSSARGLWPAGARRYPVRD